MACRKSSSPFVSLSWSTRKSKDGTRAFNLRNARQSRETRLEVLAQIVGVQSKATAAA
jgi:hypothetical protein